MKGDEHTVELSEMTTGPADADAAACSSLQPIPEVAIVEGLKAGTLLLKSDLCLPAPVEFRSKRYGAWRIGSAVNARDFEAMLTESKWNFFFVLPQIQGTAVSFDSRRALMRALNKVLFRIEEQAFNAAEIAQVRVDRFLGLSRAQVAANPRHIKDSSFLRDVDPKYDPSSLFNAEAKHARWFRAVESARRSAR